MSDRTFRLHIRIVDDDTDATVLEDYCSFDPADVDKWGGNEAVDHEVAKLMRKARYEAGQMDLADEQEAELIRSDYAEHNTNSAAYSGVK